MELNLTITPNTAAAILEALQPAVLRFFEALVNAAREAWAGIKRSAKAAGRIVADRWQVHRRHALQSKRSPEMVALLQAR